MPNVFHVRLVGSLEKRIEHIQKVANFGARDAAEFVTMRMMLRREAQFISDYMTTGVWANDVTGVSGTPSGRPHGSRIVGLRIQAGSGFAASCAAAKLGAVAALTMIKKALPIQFPLMCQADRMAD